MKRYSPPALVCHIFESILPVSYRETLIGDLIEEYPLRVESTSPFTAFLWLSSQCGRSVPCTVCASIRSGAWLINLSIAVGVYLSVGTLKVVADLVISKLVAPAQSAHVILAPVVFLMATAIGGCVAARIRFGATIFLALLVMITVAVLIDLKVCTLSVPWWYQSGFLTLGPLTVLIGPAVVSSLRPGNVRNSWICHPERSRKRIWTDVKGDRL